MRGMETESRDLRRSLYNLMWHMRGSLSREDAFMLSPQERDDIRRLIEDRMKIVKETNLPLL